jgi:hypothetical protein
VKSIVLFPNKLSCELKKGRLSVKGFHVRVSPLPDELIAMKPLPGIYAKHKLYIRTSMCIPFAKALTKMPFSKMAVCDNWINCPGSSPVKEDRICDELPACVHE